MDIARIVDGVIVNIEVADVAWIEANTDPTGRTLFVPFDVDNPAIVGLGWEPIGGFEQRPAEPETYKLTADDLTVLGVDLTHADALVAEKAAAVELAAVELAAESTPTKGTR